MILHLKPVEREQTAATARGVSLIERGNVEFVWSPKTAYASGSNVIAYEMTKRRLLFIDRL